MSTARRREMPPGGGFAEMVRAGTRLRIARFTPQGTPRGAFVVLTGRNEFIEKYYETTADLLDRGFAVHLMDWRGQGLSDHPLADRMKGHVRDFEDYVGDLEALIERVAMETTAPIFALGHSMGGHILARTLATRPATRARLAGAVLCSAMMEIDTGRITPAWAGRIAHALVLFGLGERAISAPKETGPGFNVLTSDPERAGDQPHFVAAEPLLDLGAPTFGWLDAAFRSSALLKRPGAAEAIDLPVLVAVAGADKVVRPAAERAFAARLPRATLVEIEAARHEILKERDELRGRFLAALDDWLAVIDMQSSR
ncbi:alpha/beta hydrolase [Zavarzinia compransoris]|uniref:alpha/beta fold hydrolase n=1 Tax=Zavarzinia marina TaxID=2911065 RepID=UPI001F1E1418|nr:alpha/beta hydrolase [Zavarzinia marina]MCF4165486.1 alpha/beta hydrolase [Zavarzinia marina]